VLAHELRNPLSPLVTGLELIKCYGIQHDGLQRVRSSMERQVWHLTRLVDDLLDVSRISRGKVTLQLGVTLLDEVLQHAAESARPLIAERQHELSIVPCSDDLRVYGDQVRLTQVVSNLLHNAARYTEPGGRIELSCSREGDEAVVRVVDNGRGISAEMLERIFDMFVQEREGGGGLGLGLTLVHRLVELHGGSVQAASEGPGKGSQFVVRLPLVDQRQVAQLAEIPPERAAETAPHVNGKPLHVVVVEDQDDVRDAMQALLEGWGHRVDAASDGVGGLSLVLDARPDLALIDIGLPGLDGYALARRVRAELGAQSPRLVALTGFGREEDRERSRLAGFDTHITKPAEPQELRRVLGALGSRSDRDGNGGEPRDDERTGRAAASAPGG
jgi:two-component system, sensor histidine kinase